MSATDVTRHYVADDTRDELVARVTSIVNRLTPEALAAASDAGFDQFHVRGVAATADLATLAGIGRSSNVLDAGSGFGGPSRYLARTYGCRVHGIDLTPAFVDIAKLVAARLQLDGLVSYDVGDITALPFADGSFDVVWTQHVVMNVADRDRAYREFRRVLGPAGILAFYDVVAGDGEAEPYYPVPWAQSAGTSFLLTESQTLAALERAGFPATTWHDVSDEVLAWFASAPPPVPSELSLAGLMGPRFGPMTANFARNLREGKVRIAMGIANAGTPVRR